MAAANLFAYKDMYDEGVCIQQLDTKPRPIPQISTQERTLFRNQGQTDNGYVSQGRNQEVQP